MPSLMESIISLDVGAQEPWPNDVQLFQPYPMEQILLPDNANCLATQAYLHMCGLPFKIEHRANAEFMSPSGKVPFIKCGAFVVSELEPIVQFIGNKGISLTEDFDNEQKSDLRAYMSLIFSVLMNAELYICWCDKQTYNEVTKVRNGSVYPWPLNHYQNWTKRSAVIKKLKLLNWYQKTLGSVYQEVETCCQALSERLEGKEYFFGSKPTEVDALLYGHTYSIFSNPVDFPHLFVILQRFPNLIIHCRRICFNYTYLRYIDFTKTDTDIESSRESSTHNLILKTTETSLFTQLWNCITLNMYSNKKNKSNQASKTSIDISNEFDHKSAKIPEKPPSNNEIIFKKTVEPCIKLKPSFDEDDSPKSINYLGHKVIQQHLQQDLRNKLSDFTIDTNSDLWSEKDICYIISDRDLIRTNANKDDLLFELDADDETKQNLETKYTRCSGSNSSISEQLDWLQGTSSTSTIDMNFSNNKCNFDSITTDNKNDTLNDTLNDQENIEIDKSNCNMSELDWITDYTSDTKVNNNNEIIIFDVSDKDDIMAQNLLDQIIMPKFSNCSIDGDLDWLHDFTKGDTSKMEKGDGASLICDEKNSIYDLESKPSKMDFIVDANEDTTSNVIADIEVDVDIDIDVEKCSTSSNTNAWTTIESASASSDNLAIDDNMDSTIELMNDMLISVEQMNNKTIIVKEKKIVQQLKKSKNSEVDSSSELTIETYSENHICNDSCDNIFVVNDDSFWDDDISNSISVNEKSAKHVDNNKTLEKKHSEIKICRPKKLKLTEKISNESLKKYFSCESCKNATHPQNREDNYNNIESDRNESRSSMVTEEYPLDKLSNIIIAVNQAYPENEFLKLLRSDYDISQYTTSESIDENITNNERTNSALILHDCDEQFFKQTENENNENSNNSDNNELPPKPRVFRKCRRLLNKTADINNATMRSDSKILQMYNEKVLECRNKSNNDIENIRTACSVLKSFNTKPEQQQCRACNLCKFLSSPSISHSCKCCDSNFSIKSKSVNKFSSVTTFPLEKIYLDNFTKAN